MIRVATCGGFVEPFDENTIGDWVRVAAERAAIAVYGPLCCGLGVAEANRRLIALDC